MSQPFLRVDRGRTHPLGTAVVLVEDWPPPLDHPTLDLYRAGRRGVDHQLEAREVVAVANRRVELEHPDEHGRNELAVGDPVVLNQGQRLLCVETLHHDDRCADAVDGHAAHERGRVVQRRRRQVDRVLAGAVRAAVAGQRRLRGSGPARPAAGGGA